MKRSSARRVRRWVMQELARCLGQSRQPRVGVTHTNSVEPHPSAEPSPRNPSSRRLGWGRWWGTGLRFTNRPSKAEA
jgi:hypothetical protein